MPKNPKLLWVSFFLVLAALNIIAILTAVVFAHSLDSGGPGPILKFLGPISFFITLPYASFLSLGGMGFFVAFLITLTVEATVLFQVLLAWKFYRLGSSNSNRKS